MPCRCFQNVSVASSSKTCPALRASRLDPLIQSFPSLPQPLTAFLPAIMCASVLSTAAYTRAPNLVTPKTPPCRIARHPQTVSHTALAARLALPTSVPTCLRAQHAPTSFRPADRYVVKHMQVVATLAHSSVTPGLVHLALLSSTRLAPVKPRQLRFAAVTPRHVLIYAATLPAALRLAANSTAARRFAVRASPRRRLLLPPYGLKSEDHGGQDSSSSSRLTLPMLSKNTNASARAADYKSVASMSAHYPAIAALVLHASPTSSTICSARVATSLWRRPFFAARPYPSVISTAPVPWYVAIRLYHIVAMTIPRRHVHDARASCPSRASAASSCWVV